LLDDDLGIAFVVEGIGGVENLADIVEVEGAAWFVENEKDILVVRGGAFVQERSQI
jgi:hypothetical protein